MRARDRAFHLNCFTCAICLRMLMPGEHFGMRHGAVYCRPHYEDLVLSGNHGNDMDGFHGNHVRLYNGVGGTQKGRPRKRKQMPSEMDMLPNPIGEKIKVKDA